MDRKLSDLLTQWQALVAKIAAAKALVEQEQELRKAIFALAFPKPEEGTQRMDLGEGWKLKAVHKVDRKLDEAALPAVLKQLRARKVAVDELVTYKPSLCVSIYKALPADLRAIMDEVVTSKPAMPSLEVEAPKEPK